MENEALVRILKSKGILTDYDITQLHDSQSSALMNMEESHSKFNETNSKELVSKMYHNEGGRKYMGEKYNIEEARAALNKYRGVIPSSVTCYDMYVALNEHYHNYSALYKMWFGNAIDSKIIESAIVYWFKDDDWSEDCKIWKHFNKD